MVTGGDLSSLKAALDEIDWYPHVKAVHYLDMNNAPIHTSKDASK